MTGVRKGVQVVNGALPSNGCGMVLRWLVWVCKLSLMHQNGWCGTEVFRWSLVHYNGVDRR